MSTPEVKDQDPERAKSSPAGVKNGATLKRSA